MRELSAKEITAVNGGILGWLTTRLLSLRHLHGIDHNSSNPMAATNRL
ncbi:hypothetical protein [Pseudoalteromonas arctica]|nr:hypothetical protein [Pseudoalteromonas arctica]